MGNAVFLGIEGSGKSALITALAKMIRDCESDGWYLKPVTRNVFQFLENIPDAIDGNSLPLRTATLKHYAMSLQYKGESVRNLDVLDYSDEVYRLAFLNSKDDLNPNAHREKISIHREDINSLLFHVKGADTLFVLFNLDDAMDIKNNEKNLDAIWVTNACLDYLHKLSTNPKITLVLLTQADKYREEILRAGSLENL